jgi:hypothetical protein
MYPVDCDLRLNRKKIMRLWLDDERDPQDPSIQKDFGASKDDVWVRTVEKAIELLQTGKFDSISIDYDLGISHRPGIEIANWILEQATNHNFKRIEWNAHSSSSYCCQQIAKVMMKAEKVWACADAGLV